MLEQPAGGAGQGSPPRGSGRLLRRAGLVLSSNLVARGLAFVFFVLAARWLSEADYGVVRGAVAAATLLCLLPAPFSLAWARVLAAQQRPEDQQLQTSAGLRAFAVLLAVTLAGSVIWLWLDPQLGPGAPVVVLGLSVLYAADGYFKGLMAFKRLAAYLLIGNLGQLAALALIVWLWPDLLAAPLVLLIYGLAYLLPLGLFGWPQALPAAPRPAVWAILRATLGLVLVNSANTVLLNIDLVLLGALADARSLGYYSVAKTMLTPVLVLAQSLFTVLLPMNVRASGDRRRLARAVLLIGAATLLLSAATAALAGLLLGPLFGARYLPAAPAFQVLCFGGWLYLMMTLFTSFTLGQGQDRRGRIAYSLAALAALGLLAALVPPLGILGAAWAFTGACALGALIVGVDWMRSLRP